MEGAITWVEVVLTLYGMWRLGNQQLPLLCHLTGLARVL